MVSSRWSYGPDGLRERPVAHSPLLPRWRDLQPLLLRSAGVVGLVATIMAVVSSDALHLGAEEPAALAAVEPVAPPVVVPSAELNAALEAATPEPVATAATASPPEPVTMESTSAPAPVALASATEAAKPAPEPAPPAPIAVATVAITPEPASEPVAELQPDIADFALTAPAPRDEPEPVLEPVGAAAAEGASLEEPVSAEPTANLSATAAAEQPTSAAPIEPAAPVLASELRNEMTPASPTSEVAATASAPAAREAMASLSPDTDDLPAAEISIAALRQSDAPAAATDPDRLAWPDGAATCPRDWVEPEEGSRAEDISADCMATAALFTPVAEDEQAALESAASEEATVLASLPRIPQPRPEPPADFEPSTPHKTVRVSNRNSSWPDEPPPACPGQHAKWRFVDRKAGTKEWYCR